MMMSMLLLSVLAVSALATSPDIPTDAPAPDNSCPENEVWSDYKIMCPPQNCESLSNPLYACPAIPIDLDTKNPGCNCIEGYVRDDNNVCMPSDQCPGPCGENEVYSKIKITCPPQSCEAASGLVQYLCAQVEPAPGCNCKENYMRDANNVCIPSSECPPDSGSEPITEPPGNPCGPNGTFVDCGFRCPNQYCPEDDSGVVYACKPGRPCPPGCACKPNYLRKSQDDDSCILAEECPPVECTRPNEVWAPCPPESLAEQCENVNDPPTKSIPPAEGCQPKCICKEDHYRNSSGICVYATDCPTPPSACTSDCTPTCAVPSPPNCPPYSDLKKPCCENGFILSEKGGKCIPIEDCPKTGCNGDPNAVVRRCPAPCVQSTCAKPESQACPAPCNPGCECAPGYILSKYNGKCIKIEECPGGAPKCGPNSRFVNCVYSCPTNYCPTDDSRGQIICESYPFAPCFSGCACNLNHKFNNRKEKKCIVSSDCPPVNCTRPNEVWNSCPSECQSEYCDAAYEKPVVCNTLVLNCQPKCTCKKNFFRNKNDICIPRNKCPKKKCDD